MRLSDLGEFGLIDRLTDGLAARPDVVLGAGDDAALLDLGTGMLLVATCDSQVQGRHFLLDVASPEEIGSKALAVNLSDIAAMGAEPLWALVSLLTPPDLDVAVLDGVYAGMRRMAARYDVAIVGGNVSATDGPLTIDVTLLGRMTRERALRRSGANSGDALLVSGTIGAAAAGVILATDARFKPTQIAPEMREAARRAMVSPEPQVALGTRLAASGEVTAMLDVSDGLAQDLGHLCERSGVGALLHADAIPIAPAVVAVASAYERDPLRLALTGGEDYQLLFAARPDAVEALRAAAREVGTEVTLIGSLTGKGDGIRLRLADGTTQPVAPSGWDHLRRAPEER